MGRGRHGCKRMAVHAVLNAGCKRMLAVRKSMFPNIATHAGGTHPFSACLQTQSHQPVFVSALLVVDRGTRDNDGRRRCHSAEADKEICPVSAQGARHIRCVLVQDFPATRSSWNTGGCGTFYAIVIASAAFKDLPTVKQHKLVTETLKSEIEGIHGLQVWLTFVLVVRMVMYGEQIKTIPE